MCSYDYLLKFQIKLGHLIQNPQYFSQKEKEKTSSDVVIMKDLNPTKSGKKILLFCKDLM